jgi:hypothetical protein
LVAADTLFTKGNDNPAIINIVPITVAIFVVTIAIVKTLTSLEILKIA